MYTYVYIYSDYVCIYIYINILMYIYILEYVYIYIPIYFLKISKSQELKHVPSPQYPVGFSRSNESNASRFTNHSIIQPRGP